MAVYDLKDLEERKAQASEAFFKAKADLEVVEQLLNQARFEGHLIEQQAGASADQVHRELAEVPAKDPDPRRM